MENIIRTVYGSHLQTCQLLGLPVPIKEHTTLNEKFNISKDVAIANTEMPRMRYAAIGNGGHRLVMGANNIAIPQPIQHRPTDAALFNQLPFVLRAPEDDLTAAERAKYRLRRTEIHDEKTYVAYYLKVLDMTETVPQMDYKSVDDGVTNSTSFEPNISNLNPVPPDLTNTGVNTTTGDYVTATAKVPFSMTEQDITEFLNVCNIIYGNEDYAIVSEIALCSAVDRAVSGDFNGITASYYEAISTQVVSFVNAFFAMKFTNSGTSFLFDVGATEPLFVLE